MRKTNLQLLGVLAAGFLPVLSFAGTISYVPIPAVDSDAKSGIRTNNTYTSAVDGGNVSGADRALNGVPFASLAGTGNTSTSGNVTLNALTGALTNARNAANIPADGALAEIMRDMTLNEGAADGSQQEIVLDPASLIAGHTYELRIYICNPSGQNRLVNLSFASDASAPVDTGFFNEDDATTSAGGFTDANQVYYIDYRYTWDGATTPGITIAQKSGAAPFLLYALTNQEAGPEVVDVPHVVPEEVASEDTEGDIGVIGEEFNDSDGLNRHGRWISVGDYGRCWQPSDVANDWRPYSRGHWLHSDYGWTWVSSAEEDDWGWATYHYGRWCRVQETGWCWVPGRVWAPAWVSWRYSRGGDDPTVGWAPLPPEARCAPGVGISIWSDSAYGVGPDAYNFVRVRNFGEANLSAAILPSRENVTYIQRTTNVTNIVNNRSVIYTGGPDIAVVNNAITHQGGAPVPSNIVLTRQAGSAPLTGGGFHHLQGNTLAIAAPFVAPLVAAAVLAPIVKTLTAPKIDHGWNQIKDPKTAASLRSQIAQETQGKNAQNTKAALPPSVTLKSPIAGGKSSPAAVKPGAPLGANGVKPTSNGASPTATPSTHPLHPGQALSPAAETAPVRPASTAGLHPGQKLQPNGSGAPAGSPSTATRPGASLPATGSSGATAPATPGAKHPGQKLAPTAPVTLQPFQPSATKPAAAVQNPVLPPLTAPTAPPVIQPTPHPGQSVQIPGASPVPAATPSVSGKKRGKTKPAPVSTPAAAPAPGTPANPQPKQPAAPPAPANPAPPTAAKPQATEPPPAPPTPVPASTNKKRGKQNSATPAPQPAPPAAARKPDGPSPEQRAASAAAAARQQEAAAVKQQQAVAADSARQQKAAAKQQQAAAAAAAAKQNQSAATDAARQQQAAAKQQQAAAKQQQQSAARQQQEAAAAAAAKQRQDAAAAAKPKPAPAPAKDSGKGKKVGPTPPPAPQ